MSGMVKEKNSKTSAVTVVMLGLVTAILGTAFLFWKDMTILNAVYTDLNNIEHISSSTQRLISMVQSKEHTQKGIFDVADNTQKTLQLNQSNTLSVLNDPTMVILAEEVLSSWSQIEVLLTPEKDEEGNELPLDVTAISIELGLARDGHFSAMTNLSSEINDYAISISDEITQYQSVVVVLFLTLAILVLSYLLRTHTELKMSQELAETAQIDLATGLYNRSRCQELFKSNNTPSAKKNPAILVLDLNDLKKTNDKLGHRVGDELIQSFATVLKGATNVHITPPFIGRYGGDEFIIYYDDIADEEEIKIYLKELDFYTKEYNEKESRFQISYAVGYSYITSGTEEKLTTRQLFDKADAAMYENKIAGKRERNPNYDAEQAKGDVR